MLKNLGLRIDSVLSFEFHLKEVARTVFFHLRNIAKIRQVLSHDSIEIMNHLFVSSRINYCKALLSGLPRKSFKGLQMLQNAAACILIHVGKYNHIKAVLMALHWLPFQFRADYKV